MRLALLLVCLVGAACQRPAAPAGPAGAPDTLRYAEAVQMVSGSGYRRVGIGGQAFVLHDSAAAPPATLPGVHVRVPVRRAVVLSTTHLGFLGRLGAADAVVGVVGAPWVNTPAVRARLERGDATDVGVTGTPSVEAIAALRPDVVFASSGDASALAAQLAALGIAVVPVAEHTEAHPLGRAEWIKVFGAFVGRADTARVAFDTLAARYERLAARARRAAPRPTVLVNSPYRGVWYMPGGRTFAARQLADAGADYLWAADTARTALPLSIEPVLARAQRADVWVAPGAWRSLDDGRTQEPRVALFDAFRRGAVFAFDVRRSEGGGFDIYETGVVEPDVVLADLVSIFHPALVPGHRRVYFRRLPPQ